MAHEGGVPVHRGLVFHRGQLPEPAVHHRPWREISIVCIEAHFTLRFPHLFPDPREKKCEPEKWLAKCLRPYLSGTIQTGLTTLFLFSLKSLRLPLIKGNKCMLLEDMGESTDKALLPAMRWLCIGGTDSRFVGLEASRLLYVLC